jgi:hypothetical protein
MELIMGSGGSGVGILTRETLFKIPVADPIATHPMAIDPIAIDPIVIGSKNLKPGYS